MSKVDDLSDDLAYQIELMAEAIDAYFGKDYTREHPELLAAVIKSAPMHRIADAAEVAANTMLQLADVYGSNVPGPFR